MYQYLFKGIIQLPISLSFQLSIDKSVNGGLGVWGQWSTQYFAICGQLILLFDNFPSKQYTCTSVYMMRRSLTMTYSSQDAT